MFVYLLSLNEPYISTEGMDPLRKFAMLHRHVPTVAQNRQTKCPFML